MNNKHPLGNLYGPTLPISGGTGINVVIDYKPPMFVLPDGMTVYVDVDDTLIQWEVPTGDEPKEDLIEVETRGIKQTFVVNKHNIEYIRKMAIRGHVVIVWSAGGVQWAEAVVKALEMEHLITAVLTKPHYYVDDIKDANRFMGKYVFYDKDGNRNGYTPKEDK